MSVSPLLLSSALGVVTDGVVVADALAPDQPVIFVNEAFERLTGYSSEEVVGRNCRLLQGEETDPESIDAVRDGIRSGRRCTEVLLNYRRDGSTFFNELTVAPLDVAGNRNHIVGVLRDVTERVESDHAVQQSAERYRSLINAMSEGVVMQAASGEIVTANPQAEAILGLDAEQLRGQTSIDRDPWCLKPDGSRFPGEEHPAMVALATGRPVHDVTMGVIHPGGELRWISINSEPVGASDEDDPVAVVTSFTDITERLQLKNEQIALREVAEAMAADPDARRTFALVAEQLARLTGTEAAAVLRFEGEAEGVLAGVWFRDRSDGPFAGRQISLPSTGEALRVRRAGRTLRSRLESKTHPALASLGFTETVTTPIVVDGEIWGVIGVTTGGDQVIASSTERHLERFSGLVALAVSNANARERLAERAERDSLTGLLNHRVFHERLRAEVARARRHGRPLTLALIDIDSFKQANDTTGHRVGDEMLKEVGRRLTEAIRSEDIIARVGGDEFALILPETSELDAYAFVERARQAISSRPVSERISLTASAGICDLEHAGSDHQIYELADGALYWSKAHGRDQTWIYDPDTVRELSAQERAEQLQRSQAMVGLRALARAIDAKDQATLKHSERVAKLAVSIAVAVGWSSEKIALLHEAALVHDVGKIGVPDEILLKPGRLTPEEYEEVKKHADLSAEIVGDVLRPEQVAWVRSHHERPDGLGYPDGLSREQIPDGASILATADCFDVMTASRSYSLPMSTEEAVREVVSLRDLQFAGFTVDALLEVLRVDSGAMSFVHRAH